MNPTTRDKIVRSVLIVLPALILLGMFLAPTSTPKVLHLVGTLFAIAALPILARLEPPWVQEALAQAEKELEAANAPPVALARVRAKMKRRGSVPPLAAGVFAILATIATIACGASALQIEQTVMGGIKAADCVLALVLGGTTDANTLLGSCAGVTLEEIVQIIDDFNAKQDDGGVQPSAEVTAQRRYLAEARANAVRAIAAKKASGK